MAKEFGNTEKLILAFVALIIGVSLIGIVASNSAAVTTHQSATETANLVTSRIRLENGTGMSNGSLYVTNGYNTEARAWKLGERDCDMATPSFVGNATGRAAGSGAGVLVVTTDYTFATNGKFTQNAAPLGYGNTTYIDYSYCKDDYLTQGWSRSIMNMIAGFFALALLASSLLLFYSVAKDNGFI